MGARDPEAGPAGRAGRGGAGAGGGAGCGPPFCLAGSGVGWGRCRQDGPAPSAPRTAPVRHSAPPPCAPRIRPRASRSAYKPVVPPHPGESIEPAAEGGLVSCGRVPSRLVRLLRGRTSCVGVSLWLPSLQPRGGSRSGPRRRGGAGARAASPVSPSASRGRPRGLISRARPGGLLFPQPRAPSSRVWPPRPWLACEYRGPRRGRRACREAPGEGRPGLRRRLRAFGDRAQVPAGGGGPSAAPGPGAEGRGRGPRGRPERGGEAGAARASPGGDRRPPSCVRHVCTEHSPRRVRVGTVRPLSAEE